MQNHEGFFKLFDGVVDVGAGYNRELVKDLYGGIAFHIAFLNRQNTTSRTAIYKPRLNLHYYIHVSEKVAVIPVMNLGYSFLNLSNREYDYKEIQSGLNSGGELKVLWKRNQTLDYYIFGRFDFIFLDKDESFTRLKHYRNVYLTSFGLGVRIKSIKNEK